MMSIPRKTITALVAAVCITAVPSASADCNSKSCEKRVQIKRWKKTVNPYRDWINKVAYCESRGNWQINTGNGFYGGMQFTLRSWQATGGMGYPHRASRLEQSYRSVLLLRIQGKGAWPVCGR